MKITNRYHLPQAIFQAVCDSTRKPEKFKYHVTELINNPWIHKLAIQWWDTLEEDVSDRLWSLLGQSVHSVLEKSGDIVNGLKEERLETEVSNCLVIGTPDLLHGTRLEDYKVTSVYAFLLGNKPEWEKQLNIYSYKYAQKGFSTDELRINAILRDWQKSKARQDHDYPPIPFQMVDVPLWKPEEQQQYLTSRVELFSQVDAGLEPEPCNDEERWARPTTYAVIKKGNKRATRVLESHEDAQEYINTEIAEKDRGRCEIVKRPGEHIKCMDYCMVRDFCPHNIYNEKYMEVGYGSL